MKKIFLAAIAATTLFAACNKENVNSPEVAGAPAKLTIVFDNPTQSRALDTANETVIKSATAFVLSLDGAILNKFYITTADINLSTKEYEVTTAATKVVVIANTDLTGTASTNLTELKKELATLEALNGTNGFFASGTSAVLNFNQDAADGTSKLATATVAMKLLPARLDVKVTNNMTNYSGTTGLVLQDVAVLYSAGFAHWLAATENGIDFSPLTTAVVSPAKYFRSGYLGWSSDTSGQNAAYASGLLKTWATPATTAFEDTFYVYPIASGAYDENTILAIRGIWKGPDGSLNETRYFPLHFTAEDAKEELVSGKKYTINIDLTGDAKSGGGGGVDPKVPIIDSYINVSVSIASWVAATQINKDFE